MRFLWKKKKKSDISEPLFPTEKEFWLMRGEFRNWSVDQTKNGYYGLCAWSTDAICPPGERPCQNQFYRLVYCTIKNLLQNNPSVLLIEDVSRSGNCAEQINFLKQLAANYAGNFLEEHSQQKDSYAFMFPEMPTSFFEEVYWWMTEHTCTEDVYAQYSTLEKPEFNFSSLSEVRKQTNLNILIDDVHPVLIIQLASKYPLAQVTDALFSACCQEGWKFSVK